MVRQSLSCAPSKGSPQVLDFGSARENPMNAVFLAVSLFMPLSFCCVASAQLTKVTVGNNAISGNGLPAWMAKETGIFRKYGLDVQIVYFRGGTITAMALVARETPIG